MHSVAAFFASIITFVSGFFAPPLASNSPPDIRASQPAAAAVAQTEIAGNPFNDAAAASVVVAASAADPAPTPPPSQTVINQPVIERIIERIIPQGGTISAETLAAILADFEQSISSRITAINPPPATIPAQVAAGGNAGSYNFFPASQRIDQITNTAINTPTITGGTISGASVSGYLPLSGGTLTGALSGTDLNLSGALTAGTLNIGGLSSSGALFAPYFSATSTTATSTFAGGLTAANGSFSILQNGNVGIGTAAPSIAGVNSNSRVLSIVGDGTLVNARGVLELANPRASGSLAANDTAGSAFFVMSNNSGNPYIAGILGSLSGSGGANGFGGKLQFQTKADNNASSATTKMVLDQNGNVGIGTTTPWGKLSITGSGTGAGLAFAVADSANTPRVVIQDNGNVGIGTTSPGYALDVNGTINIPLDTYIKAGGIGWMHLSASQTARLYGTAYQLYTGTVRTLRQQVDSSGNFDFNSGQMYIQQSNGNVGIGTTSPTAKLEIAGGASAGTLILNSNALDGSLYFGGPTGANSTYIYGYRNSGSAGRMAFYTDNTERLRIAGDGKVAIGAGITPQSALDVSGGVSVGSYAGTNAAPSNGMIISGNVGIGTTTPGYKLEIRGSGDVFALGGSAAVTHKLGFDGSGNPYIDFVNTNKGIFRTGGTDRMVIDSSGNVGIGTTTPGQALVIQNANHQLSLNYDNATRLNIYSNASQGVLQAQTDGVGYNALLLNPSGGNVGIGTSTPQQKLSIAGYLNVDQGHTDAGGEGGGVYHGISFGSNQGESIGSNHSGAGANQAGLDFYTAWTKRLSITNAGNIGIGTTTPTAQLSTTGTVRFAGLGSAGANLVTDALGNVTASSDERLKDKQGDFTRGLAAINAISPVLYKWRPETGFDTQSTYAGFFAQNVQSAIPEAVSPDSRGYLTLADRPILAALVNATKEIGTIAGAFKSSLIAWLGNADNGITAIFARDIYASNGTFETTSTQKLCITDGANDNAPLCLTKAQLAALLGQTGAAAAPASVIPSAPVIELNGNASSTIEVGDTYNDLGARIVAPESDLNLGIIIVLDGATTTAVSIDTSAPGEHIILYTVTSPTTGLTGSVVRTVIVSPAEQSPEPPANDNPFNAPATSNPANDNTSSTSLLITEPAVVSL
ncbi:beta strand repeat-containing protein [Methylocystis suflitae]|uniref:beta strand repeat-containing protein n=1 Tax=Methylocystis suflitae TaxID=2951405 RepID=UPI00210B70D6|nr:tail fiber domain-containing protein [Methylocystis suflitae]MCQ4188381.1 DUF5011 domain-containing protein [Methylocystis suflitae]